MRNTAPLASSTSLPQLSQTRIVLRAMTETLAEMSKEITQEEIRGRSPTFLSQNGGNYTARRNAR